MVRTPRTKPTSRAKLTIRMYSTDDSSGCTRYGCDIDQDYTVKNAIEDVNHNSSARLTGTNPGMNFPTNRLTASSSSGNPVTRRVHKSCGLVLYGLMW